MNEVKQEEFILTSLPSDLIKKTTEFLAPNDTVNLLVSKDFSEKIKQSITKIRVINKRINNYDLKEIVQVYPKLKELDLSKCTNISDDGLQHLSVLNNLQTLCLRYCSKITDDRLKHLSTINNLQTLDLSECDKITDDGLQHLPKSLQALILRRCSKITDDGLQHLSTLNNLQTLDLFWCRNITDDGLQHLPKSLQTLTLSRCSNISDDGFQHLPKSLQALNYSSSYQGIATLLAKNINLINLRINGCNRDIHFIFNHAELEVLEPLLNKITDINAKDGSGNTLLDIAINRSQNNLLCTALMEKGAYELNTEFLTKFLSLPSL